MVTLEDEVGDIIAKARMGQGLSVDALADAADMTSKEIDNIESYKTKPTEDQLAILADILSLDTDKLIDIGVRDWAPGRVEIPEGRFKIETISVPYGGYRENCYILECEDSGLAAVVDPGGSVREIIDRITDHNLSLGLVLITHAHGDHIGGLKDLLKPWPTASVASSMVERESVTRSISNEWLPAKEGVPLNFAGVKVFPLSTPGHTPGSTCYVVENICFTGDTLFAGSVGRVMDVQVYQQMLMNIRGKVLSLPDDTVLLPGHGPATAVAEEKAHNPFF